MKHIPAKALRMMFWTIILIFTSLQIHAQDLETELFALPDVIFKEINHAGKQPAYELKIKQPIDHKAPEKGWFYQRAFLTHAGFDRPTVIVTEGYDRSTNRPYELSNLLKANQIDVEHRYFGISRPDSAHFDWQYLTLEQATADLHHINELFRNLYKGKWISTGISKGGQTTIFYRYFYPNDVDVSVPYVAPLNLSLEDQRIYDFINHAGTDECRAKILEFQKTLLKKRNEILPLLKWYSKGGKLKFTYLTLEQAFEYGVLEYSFSFWQWGADCSKIPGKNASIDEMLDHFIEVSGISFFSDHDIKYFESHYYQAGSQMGYYGYETEPFKGLLKALPMNPHPSAIFMPEKLPLTFDGKLMKKVYDWTQNEANNMLYINGAIDTWSATAPPPSEVVNSLWFYLKGKDHAAARISNMDAAQRTQFNQAIEDWLGIKLN
ncbi:MAG: hypothetical protein H6581_02875 [Bacteroidia bacterium]|nr:hypothetical protein [Bacteroidia bacterium]